jgi:hypothetical protein
VSDEQNGDAGDELQELASGENSREGAVDRGQRRCRVGGRSPEGTRYFPFGFRRMPHGVKIQAIKDRVGKVRHG